MSVTGRKFTVFEGPDFSGKSTLHKAYIERLQSKGIEPVVLREPGGTELGERLRKVILSEYNETVHPETDILMHMAYRVQNVRETIAPALREDKWVVMDRFLYSTWALNVQRYLDTHPTLPDLFMSLMPAVTGGVIPEPVVFIVKTPKEIRDQRREARRLEEGLDRMELLPEDIQARIDAAYEQLEQGPSTLVVDGTLPLEEQVDFVINSMEQHLERIALEQEERAKRTADLLAVTEGKKTNAEVEQERHSEGPSDINPIPADFDLESALVKYAEENIVDGLFDEVPTAQLEAVKAYYKEVAIDIVRDIFAHTGGDTTIFTGSRVGQLNAKIHSLVHYGYKLKVREQMLADKKVTAGEADENTSV